MQDSASARALVAAGYEVRSRVLVECLVACGPEQIVGRGVTEEAALEDVIAQLLPSRLGRMLFADTIAALSARISLEAATATATPSIADTAGLAVEPSAEPDAVAVLAVEPPPPPAPAEPLPTAEAAADVSPPAPPSLTSASPPEAAAESVQMRTTRPPARRVRPEDVDRLAAPFYDEAVLRAFARLAPERQRRRMLAVICDARALEELAPDDREVELAVARVARRLTEIGKMFWPGSVRALQAAVCPDDVRLEWRVAGASHLRTWQEAAALAAQLVAEDMARSAALDADGWADHAERTPRPDHPDALLAEAEATLRTVLGDGEQPRRASELLPADLAQLHQATCRLRWVRGAVSDDIAWCKALGRVRRSGAAHGVLGERLHGALDPRTRPPVAWAKMLGPAEDPAEKNRTAREMLTAALPGAPAAPDTLMAWLLRAFEASLPTPKLVEMLAAHKDAVLTLTEQHKDHESRSVRSKLRKLALGLAPEVPAAAAPAADAAAAEEPAHALDPIVARIRPQTEGQRVLFVSNREDPELGAVLTELLGVASIVWCDGSLRRVQAQCERIGKGTYDLVLSATGFQVHGVDTALQRASSAAKVRYVRVNKGRPVACVQAIARELGLAACAA